MKKATQFPTVIRALQIIAALVSLSMPSLLKSEEHDSASRHTGLSFTAEEIPSALWPTYVTTQVDIKSSQNEETLVRSDQRGVLHRAEGDLLVVDFGRNGVLRIRPEETDFYAQVGELITGESSKQFPNFALQLGNKLMDFGRGEKSGAIRFDNVKATETYILLYLDTYSPDLAQALLDFGLVYNEIKETNPLIEVALLPKDRKFYDFAFTTGFRPPFVTPHLRLGYIESFQHGVVTGPAFVAVDSNGRVLARSDAPLQWENLGSALRSIVSTLEKDD